VRGLTRTRVGTDGQQSRIWVREQREEAGGERERMGWEERAEGRWDR